MGMLLQLSCSGMHVEIAANSTTVGVFLGFSVWKYRAFFLFAYVEVVITMIPMLHNMLI